MHQLTFQSSFENQRQVQIFTEEVIKWANLNESTASAVSLALNEAVTNAIKHGNNGITEKKVNIRSKILGHYLLISVEDEGIGFSPSQYPNPLREENLHKTSGRGIYLMNQFCDEVRYSDKGNQITLIFKRE